MSKLDLIMKDRYIKNIDEILTEKLQEEILTKKIAVIGCGGQGGYILEFLARLGVKSIIFWDGDYFEITNLNRQNCTINSIGKNKVEELEGRLKLINPDIEYYSRNWFFGQKNTDFEEILKVDFIFYAADCYYNIKELRSILRKAIEKGIPLIDCPVTVLGGYVRIETLNDFGHFDQTTLELINQSYQNQNLNIKINQSAYKCAYIAAEAINEMILYFSNSKFACIDTDLIIDIYHHKMTQRDKFGFF